MAVRFSKKNKSSDDNTVALGSVVARSQPHSVEIEQALLACCIIEGGQDSISHCLQNKISANSFYLPAHKTIWNAILSIYEDGSPINEIFLCDKLISDGTLNSKTRPSSPNEA